MIAADRPTPATPCTVSGVAYRLVCLDAGFTLIRPRETMADRMGRVLREHGHQPDEEELRRAWDAADGWFWDEYHRPGNETWTSDERIDDTWRSYHRLMLEALGFADADREVLESVLVAQMATESWELYEDTQPALDRLGEARRAGARAGEPLVAVVSDWGSALQTLLEGLGVTAYVDRIYASGAVGLAKPAPEFYGHVCGDLGVDPAHAVMIGDSLRADVLGAQSAGMGAMLLDRAGTAADVPEGTRVVADLVDAVEIALAARTPT